MFWTDEEAEAAGALPQIVAVQSYIRRHLAKLHLSRRRLAVERLRAQQLTNDRVFAVIAIQRFIRCILDKITVQRALLQRAEEERAAAADITPQVIAVQSIARRYIAKRRAERMRIDAAVERYTTIAQLSEGAAVTLQRFARGWLVRHRPRPLPPDHASFVITMFFRLVKAKRRVQRMRDARAGLVARHEQAFSEGVAATVIQAAALGFLARRRAARARAAQPWDGSGAPTPAAGAAVAPSRGEYGWLFGRDPWVVLRSDAAATIQRAWRARAARQAVAARRLALAAERVDAMQHFYASRIAAWWRGRGAVVATRRRLVELAAVRVLQRSGRAYIARLGAADACRRIRAEKDARAAVRKVLMLQRWWRGMRRVHALRQQRAAYVAWEATRMRAITAQISIASVMRGRLGRKRAAERRAEVNRLSAMREQVRRPIVCLRFATHVNVQSSPKLSVRDSVSRPFLLFLSRLHVCRVS